MGWNFDPGDIVALLALLLSGWSVVKTNSFNKRQKEFIETNDRLNLMLIERETSESTAQKKADLSANFYKAGKSDWRLKVFNRGRGTATNVRLVVNEAAELFLASDIERKFPVPSLEQHQSVEIICSVHMGSPSRSRLTLTWDDSTGQGHEKELTPVRA